MSRGTSAIVELGAIGALFAGAVACTLGSLSKQPYDLVEVRFCPPSANGYNSIEQRELDKTYCSIPRFLLREEWDMRGLFGSRLPDRTDVKLKRFLPTDNPKQQWMLTGTAICLGGISTVIAIRNNMMQAKYYSWLETLKTTNFELWQDNRSQRDLKTVANQLNTQFKADIYSAVDNQNRVEAGLISTERLAEQQQMQDNLGFTQYEFMIAELRKKIAEEELAKAKADKEKHKLLGDDNESPKASKSNKLELGEQYQWINKLLKLPFRVLSGEQGSGKSTLERLMIRLLKDDGWHIVIINPETNPAVWSGVQVLADADEINEFFEAFPQTIRERQQQARNLGIDEDDYLDYIKDKNGLEGKVAVFLMESNTYEVHGVNADLWADFLKQSLTNIRKWGYTVCLTAHSDNQTSIASRLQGFSKLIDSSPRVDCIAKAGANGEATSSGKAWLKMKGLGDKNPVEVDLYNYPKSKNFGDEPKAKPPPEQSTESTTSTGDWYEEIKKWVSEMGRPTSVDVKAKWESLTGHTLNSEGLRELMKYLEL
ncbi:MAG: ATP-binding protein [Nostoc sp. ChiSLP01]|nr:ATP-binding protein [Nostoc sp. CmiSLP01]MDZ8282558.1 ATP-binding protein [Nostoc sp. ChiSLP01]